MSLDAYLEPPEPEDDADICTSCEYSNCICDLPYEMEKEREIDYPNN
jgi:hypothetical protein